MELVFRFGACDVSFPHMASKNVDEEWGNTRLAIYLNDSY